MIIEKLLCTEGLGGFFFDDEEAIKKGAIQDGFTYKGKPLTPGFTAIRMPARAICVMLVLSDGQVAYGDCIWTQYPVRSGRDPLLPSKEVIATIEKEIVPRLQGRELANFKTIAEEIDTIQVRGKRLLCSVRYGVTQALLDAVAKAKKKTMAEVIAEEFHTKLADKPIPLWCQCGDDWYSTVDKMILRKVSFMPLPLCNTIPKFRSLLRHIKWVKKRIMQLADENYQPTFFYDLYGTMGLALDHDITRMIKYFRKLKQTAQPYNLLIEDPLILNGKKAQIEAMKKLRRALRKERIGVKLVADEWIASLKDVKEFVEAGATDLFGTHPNDLGGINKMIEAIQFCRTHDVEPFLGGTSAETERVAQIRVHIALATQPAFMLVTPGMGVDEGVSIIHNETQRTLVLLSG